MWDVLSAVWADKAMWSSDGVQRLAADGGEMQDLRGTRINKILVLNKMLKSVLVSSCSHILLNALSSCR